ncbi:hypothetical protein Q7C36_023078 [Tachysurus vachellii]|uniref:Uncharacterized protein n=1 Tax=Tachysurus vachellii TaxID=175792 RepID=A0AA88LG52_TACVA|nr:hypothetical protein Q7C36_023078 [Tachysurus vachellii]
MARVLNADIPSQLLQTIADVVDAEQDDDVVKNKINDSSLPACPRFHSSHHHPTSLTDYHLMRLHTASSQSSLLDSAA